VIHDQEFPAYSSLLPQSLEREIAVLIPTAGWMDEMAARIEEAFDAY
jgi:hypothetical protein